MRVLCGNTIFRLSLWLGLIFTGTCSVAAEISESVRVLLSKRCLDCHDADQPSGGVDIETLLRSFDPELQMDEWIQIEGVIAKGKMPPLDEEPLAESQRTAVVHWFEREFVMPGGVQHAGPIRPRRLTREELQNTLEDILHVDIRAEVTNSRLHVIPDTIVEKFFPAGVRGESGFSNDAETLAQESLDIQTYARCFSLVLSLLDANQEARSKVFGAVKVADKLPSPESRRIIEQFGEEAFRRPLTEAEVSGFQAVHDRLAAKRSAFEAMKSTFLAMLLSPPFLYRWEEPPAEQAPVTGNELAARLSYFLWSAPPDEKLRALAKRGRLRDPDVLREQVRRMLADPKRIALAENLGGEWFDYKALRQKSAVNQRSDKMAGFYRTQYEEALLFFDSVIRFDQPIFRLVDADWAFLNRHQAGIYQLGMTTKTFADVDPLPPISIHFRSTSRQVEQGNYEYQHQPLALMKLNDPNRGGFITLGPTLSVTSTENRTSPIRRGVWVMERVLGEHFEVPENVPDLEETQKKVKSQNLSQVELLQLHSSQSGCASCHKYIDPVGFGLEMYDQLGIARSIPLTGLTGEKLHWTPRQISGAYSERAWQLREPLTPGASTRIHFQYTKGRHRLDVRNVRLIAGDFQLSDNHFGFTGNAQRDNVWSLRLPADAPREGWRLVAEIKGDGGNDSHGTITVAGPHDKEAGYQLPNGKSFASPAELKMLLLSDYRAEVVDNAARRVLSYALGRRLLPTDRPAIKQIKEAMRADDYRMNALMEAVVLSYPFRHKEN